ncbi:glycoside hydrolase family 13 protein [Jaapia argillacea MUCL 33604]|uniref:Glycoside hydrolase family 13 protein n=1 Tax=Jaapia argillacea MUCL 33604 TaxID=933084 RepID=A0A067PVT8_9AGAM|nr:glycoside hydrolase family 13 protein [Jaapia argillacea MUCL 33604]
MSKVTTLVDSTFGPPLDRAWWKSAVVYQIYPISFCDSNGDGFGDLNGILTKLDYLKDLGVDVIWLSPIYKSPLADMGYDIADYCDIDPRYGTLQDWDKLIEGVHQRGMKLMMDLVVNHTSDEHDWFIQSRSGKDNPKRDWYVWRPPKYDAKGNRKPPNNWKSAFQGSAWEYDENTDEYYLHIYLTKQPDLNWDNPKVRDAVYDMMNWWVSRGCDGFRMDVINLISKVEGLPDAPIIDPNSEYHPGSVYYANGPRVHEYIQEMNKRVLSKHDLITVGETPFTPPTAQHALIPYVLPSNNELNMVFQFELMGIDAPLPQEGQTVDDQDLKWRQWELSEMKQVVNRWQTFGRDEGFWNALYIENHDRARSVSRFGNDSPQWRTLSAKLLAMLQATQSGTLYVYQGEEIGMKNVPTDWGLEEYKDVCTINFWKDMLNQRRKELGKNDVDMSDILEGIQHKARDHARTPMQWDTSLHSGFTTGIPWMRVNDDYVDWNVQSQLSDPSSIRTFWKNTLRVRKENEVLTYGDFKLLRPSHEQIFAYTRTLDQIVVLVLLNFGEENIEFSLSDDINGTMRLILGNYTPEELIQPGGTVILHGWEGRVYIQNGR